MRFRSIVSPLILAALLAAPVAAQRPALPQPREIAFGADPLQRLDFYPAANASGAAPLFVFVHGGGWKRGDKRNATGAAKIAHFTGRGHALASVNYRLVPDARVEDQAQDVANAIARLIRDARSLGVDPGRIVLAGHSAGAHLSALVATDPQYLRRAGVGMERIKGVILLDGAAYDVPVQAGEGPGIMRPTYTQAFGTDPARQRALSPTLHAAAPNAPRFLILHVEREDGRRQSEALAAALRKAGTQAEVRALRGRGLRGHMEINRALGDPDYPGTGIVDAWIDALP
ncbi:alpha/beta hydrolase [Sphingomonas koreensis]|jgi:arylformamidase|uniref:Alpha/beta hydrolase n=1 Tax=Sphingomonas koreensis TaxID=93064 RepID=A0A1L6JDL3_9SPHN|nr:alpha/beta hydrolase [Sphingomonas koreensis]APR54021.1 esterase [Sphingomonas koreensis]MDC7808991.1 alpha/beta hydrolase [Sphingomonas koreensis]RSU18654.1 alpha/beta hydrolase [Sphingomonas koreensis]RSU25429.1 alpha/beta hydrolase [Sphingomonas koreensis]RSU25834.1 alpha/beta hydrolase [Sphingomonas koreensis]